METEEVLDLHDTTPLGYHAVAADGVDQMLQAVLIHCGIIDGQGLESMSSDSPPSEMTGSLSRTRTLRELRQTGRWRDLTREAQTTLLGGTLCRYSSEAEPLPPLDARHAQLAATTTSARRALSSSLRSSLDENESAMPDLSDAPPVSSEGMSALRQSFRRLVDLNEAELQLRSVHSVRTMSVLEDELDVGVLPAAREIEALDEETLLAASLAQDDNNTGAPPALDATPPARFEEAENSWVVDDLGDTTMSLRTVMSQSFGTTFSPAGMGDVDGNLISVLRQLAYGGSATLDEVLMRSITRILQMGTVLSDQRLSDTEIGGLPQVRFQSAEEQACAICLEAYQPEELLTALPCSHFFHVDCLAKWLQRSPQCPLCRGPPKVDEEV